MLWFFKKNIFSIKSMLTVEYDLEHFSKEGISYPIVVDGMKATAKRLMEINPEYEERIGPVLRRMDFTPPFDIGEAKRRLDKGYYFIILENDGRVIGWSWAGIGKVWFNEFNCNIELKTRHAFFFNTYVAKEFRGKELNQIVFNEKLYQLKNDGYIKLWGLIYKSNEASLRSLRKIGFKEPGYYRFLKLLFMNFRLSPKDI